MSCLSVALVWLYFCFVKVTKLRTEVVKCHRFQGAEGLGDLRVWESTYHLFIRQLSALDAAAVPHCLLVPLALGVTEQVHLGGDLQTHWSEVTDTDTIQKKARGQRDTYTSSITVSTSQYVTVLFTVSHFSDNSDNCYYRKLSSKLNMIPKSWLTSAK